MPRKMTLTIVGGGYVVGNLVSGLAALAGKKMFDDQRHVGGYGEQACVSSYMCSQI